MREAGAGDPDAAARRLEFLAGLASLTISEAALTLAKRLLESNALPQQAKDDALHIAIATAQGMDFLLTWNCRHIANVTMRHQIELVCRTLGFEPPVIATPDQIPEK
uniref:PIN domain-containing protein n=1 Tax=Candidatus Kentrum eta TaxID=2126337 RepID=A0A450VQC3_9GAMM|nr:MAG: hypothetical protein BECKH772B_GA0070898_103894 [Candidatus Kentron sp. H]VFK04122.1 MAG: hypothetical protein BECKH772A_GA0070896_103834 [Candidatus Kentron sp. H]VFK06979.1 MAG: hypothetical protein BECKH772C_GA0070978_103874 [Candidatus Kentron sp. H]